MKRKQKVIFGKPDLLDVFNSALGPLASYTCPFNRNLGVIIDNSFKLDKQINAVIKASFF